MGITIHGFDWSPNSGLQNLSQILFVQLPGDDGTPRCQIRIPCIRLFASSYSAPQCQLVHEFRVAPRSKLGLWRMWRCCCRAPRPRCRALAHRLSPGNSSGAGSGRVLLQGRCTAFAPTSPPSPRRRRALAKLPPAKNLPTLPRHTHAGRPAETTPCCLGQCISDNSHILII